jgi:hypothetical protein
MFLLFATAEQYFLTEQGERAGSLLLNTHLVWRIKRRVTRSWRESEFSGDDVAIIFSKKNFRLCFRSAIQSSSLYNTDPPLASFLSNMSSSTSTPFSSNSLVNTREFPCLIISSTRCHRTNLANDTAMDSPINTPHDSPALNATNLEKPLPFAKDVHLILSDVDGTLFTSDHQLHQK